MFCCFKILNISNTVNMGWVRRSPGNAKVTVIIVIVETHIQERVFECRVTGAVRYKSLTKTFTVLLLVENIAVLEVRIRKFVKCH